ncbi:MAG: DUF1501 domain-containing protein [Burkholderiaceae bacterium]|jgi:hypothetical protein|nr:DUF1501 domain-containing protein [Burkholderiaceae bacterium]
MDRRDFLKMVGTVVPAWSLIPIANAQSSLYSGRILINIHASGGLDASSWTDPRETNPAMNNYAAAGTPAGLAGDIRFAPMGSNATFFSKYYNQMLVINGVNSETNSHTDGTRTHATGRLDMGYPNVAELFAAQYGRGLPMPWLNSGGFSTSAGLMPATPVPDSNTFRALVAPNAASATNDFMKQADLNKAFATRAQRMAALQATGTMLPKQSLLADQFSATTDARALMERVASFIPATFDTFTQAHVGLVAAQAGITSTIQLASGGFDGHSQLANAYATALPRLTDMVDYIWQKSAALGLSNRIFLRIYSEFGRTPLNAGNGKDHWSVGSQVLMEANPAWGNRVFGASGPKHEQLKINTATGAVDPVNGVVIKPRHIHDAMRKYLGITTTDPKFNLKVPATENFDFFNPVAKTGYPNL